ncbi:MAG: c-type cytochrome [Planctomycetes bacterium]|nr:c-type cytochrome [Planctomycetota bacterium]
MDSLRQALTFAATFDVGLDAEVARGDARLHHGPSWGPPRNGEPGIVPSGAVTRERRDALRGGALRGSALRFHRRTDEILFFHGEHNTPWQAQDWNGTLSFWLRAEPQSELLDGFCDPITVTAKDWNDAGLFCEFEKRPDFRHFRMGAYADHAVWNATGKPWEQLSFEEKSLAQVEADDPFGGRFTHVAFAFERFNSGAADGVARMYLDGKLAATLAPRMQTWTWAPGDQRIILGLNYVGWIDEIAWFDRALGDAEITALHALPGGLADLFRPRVPVGAAKIDVTPDHPIRLCGYASRDSEATSAVQPLFARALAVGERESLAVMVALDNTAVPQRMTDEVAARLARRFGLARERFTLCVTHTHTAPVLDGGIDCMFGRPIPADQWQRIERYSRWLVDRMEQAGADAIAARVPAFLAWSEGSAAFARNRRTAGGPVDHALPVMAAFAADGSLLATVQNYACHCTTCNGAVNQHCGDWAGYASEAIEAVHAGAVSLTVIGCGADANPADGSTADLRVAQRHGKSIADEVERLLQAPMTPLLREGGAPKIAVERLELPYALLPTRAEFEARAKAGGAVGFHAESWLKRLDRGEALPAALPYSVQAWQWGDDLVQLFLPGEVVVDYSLRLKREFDRARLWVSAYSNDVPCYIPSERILREGGYEASGAMTYYGRPGPLASGVEAAIVAAVHRLVPEGFAPPADDPRFPAPKSAEESKGCFELSRDDLTIELAACEPQVESPVAIDFAADGTVYVCEMSDYPSGMDGNYQPGGRVTWLRDRDGDGRFEAGGVFVEGLPFPTGVMAWKRGALICAAPDILYAEDRDGDGRADVKRVLYTGFSTENYQARVNSLTWGLDGWVYASCGLFGGVITPFNYASDAADAAPIAGAPVDCRGRDFRIDPDRGVIEAIEGTSQQGRVRDDWGRWFGCDSGWLIFQVPLADRVLRRNPYVPTIDPRWNVLTDPDPRQLFQISHVLERFNDAGDASRVTSACGIGIYRDTWLGAEFHGNAFTCEPVANVVRRTVLDTGGAVAQGRRAPEEQEREFLASRDPWFRPVQATTGPDGALWIVDMYRFVIEHPRWIPAAKLADLDVRAGSDKGRLWRVVKKGAERRRVLDVAGGDEAGLHTGLVSDNGVVRDLAHREWVARGAAAAIADLDEQRRARERIGSSRRAVAPAAVVQESWCFEQLGIPGAAALNELLVYRDDVPDMVRFACMPLAERYLAALVDDPDAPELSSKEKHEQVNEGSVWQRSMSEEDDAFRTIQAIGYGDWPPIEEAGSAAERLATAAALGASSRPIAGRLLGRTLCDDADDPWIRAAVLSAAPVHAGALLDALLRGKSSGLMEVRTEEPSKEEVEELERQGRASEPARQQAIEAIVATVAALPDERREVKQAALEALLGRRKGPGTELDLQTLVAQRNVAAQEPWRWRALAPLVVGATFERELDRDGPLAEQFGRCIAAATFALLVPWTGDERCLAALELLFQDRRSTTGAPLSLVSDTLLEAVAEFLAPARSTELGRATLAAYGRVAPPAVAARVLARLASMLPELRTAALDLLLSRPEWRAELVAALESGTVPRALLDAAARERLLATDDLALRARAAKLLAPTGTKKRAQVLAQFQPALALQGDLAHGRELFARICASCHAFRGTGFDVGPDLAALGDRSAPRLLEAILDPNAAVNGEFVSYQVVLHDGSDLGGLIRGESSTGFTLVQANDMRRALLRRDVKEVKASKLSLMPEGHEEGLVAQDFADLIAWTQSGPLRIGQLSAEQIAAGRAELAGRPPLNGFTQLLERFDDFMQPSWLGVVPMHYCRQLDGTGVVRWKSGAALPLPGDPARVRLRFAAAVGFLSQPSAGFTLALDGKELLRFDVVVNDTRWRSADGDIELDFECRAAHSEDATGIMTLTLPAARLAAGATAELTVVGGDAGSQRWFGVLVP